jgi:hypothetical protein
MIVIRETERYSDKVNRSRRGKVKATSHLLISHSCHGWHGQRHAWKFKIARQIRLCHVQRLFSTPAARIPFVLVLGSLNPRLVRHEGTALPRITRMARMGLSV